MARKSNPKGLTILWYDVPDFAGGGTTLKVTRDDTVVHFIHYPPENLDDARKMAEKIVRDTVLENAPDCKVAGLKGA